MKELSRSDLRYKLLRFWVGVATVNTHYVSYYKGFERINKIDYINIYIHKHGCFHQFSRLGYMATKNILCEMKYGKHRRLNITIFHEDSIDENYTFNKIEIKNLVPLLEMVLAKEWVDYES